MTANSDHATTILGARIPQIDQALGLVGTEPPFKDVLDNARHAMARMLTMNDQATALEAVDSSDVIEEAARLFAAGELDIDGVSDLAAQTPACCYPHTEQRFSGRAAPSDARRTSR